MQYIYIYKSKIFAEMEFHLFWYFCIKWIFTSNISIISIIIPKAISLFILISISGFSSLFVLLFSFFYCIYFPCIINDSEIFIKTFKTGCIDLHFFIVFLEVFISIKIPFFHLFNSDKVVLIFFRYHLRCVVKYINTVLFGHAL